MAGPPLDVFEAATLGRAARVAELVDGDASLARAYSSDGFTALHFAAYYGSPETVALLIERGANIEAVTRNFLANMPLHAAAAGRGPALETCEVLVRAGANVNAKQHGGFSVLHTPAHHGGLEMAELFLREGADASATNDEGKTPVDVAREQGHIGAGGAAAGGCERGAAPAAVTGGRRGSEFASTSFASSIPMKYSTRIGIITTIAA